MFVVSKNKDTGIQQIYHVRFSHTPYIPGKTRTTTCTISLVHIHEDGRTVPTITYSGTTYDMYYLSTGESRTSKEDVHNFNKAYGRYVSLQRALQKLCESGSFDNDNFKDFIKQLWKEHPKGMKEAISLFKDPFYSSPWY